MSAVQDDRTQPEVPSFARLVRLQLADGERQVVVRYALNGGYAGRDTDQVQHHVDELAALGVPAPSRSPHSLPTLGRQRQPGRHHPGPSREDLGRGRMGAAGRRRPRRPAAHRGVRPHRPGPRGARRGVEQAIGAGRAR